MTKATNRMRLFCEEAILERKKKQLDLCCFVLYNFLIRSLAEYCISYAISLLYIDAGHAS